MNQNCDTIQFYLQRISKQTDAFYNNKKMLCIITSSVFFKQNKKKKTVAANTETLEYASKLQKLVICRLDLPCIKIHSSAKCHL